MGIIKLGGIIFASYWIGGKIGGGVIDAMAHQGESAEAFTGAQWAGRVTTFVLLSYILK